MFRPALPGSDIVSTLYRIDPATGSMTSLHTYSATEVAGYIEGLTLSGGSLYGLTTEGKLYRFDLQAFDATYLGDIDIIGYGVWTGLVTIPEPSVFVGAGLALLVAVSWRRRRRA
jgi:hypothetical protein